MDDKDAECVKIFESNYRYKYIGEKLFNKLEEDGIFNKKCITVEQRRKDIKKIDLCLLWPKIESLGRSEKTKEFSDFDRTFLLLTFYLFLCENIKNILDKEIYEKICDKLPDGKNLREKIRTYVSLHYSIKILESYIECKKISDNKVFSLIDIDLRNSIAHFTFEDNEDFLNYPKNSVINQLNGEEILHKILHAGAIFNGLQEAKMDFYAKNK